LPVSGKEYVDRMLNAAGRMRQLISDLLAFSRVTTQARPHRRADLGAVVADALSNLEIAVLQAGATVRVDPLPVVAGDEGQLRQLFQNLISNALKFRKKDVPPVVDVTAEVTGANVCTVTVGDNGIGFAEKYSGRIFELFQRLHGRDEYDGTGIGLAISKKIVERHGGTITAFSAEGDGARFVFTLPLWRERAGNGGTDEPT
jgi:light-regulated signal transduction histidine kinase (bacteriophytochrome)